MKKNWMLASILALTITGGGILAMGSGHTALHHLKSQQNQNKLTAQNRDALVAEVESLKANLSRANPAPGVRGEGIPDGAVMAFDLAQCPAGWTVYNEAKDKFIMGAQYNNDLKATGGNSNIKLTVGQLPPHFFYISAGSQGRRDGIRDNKEAHISDFVGNDVERDSNRSYRLAPTRDTPKAGRTNTLGNADPINILPPYIKLLYCKKGGDGSRELGNKPGPAPKKIDGKCGGPGLYCAAGTRTGYRKTKTQYTNSSSRTCEGENGGRDAQCSRCEQLGTPPSREKNTAIVCPNQIGNGEI